MAAERSRIERSAQILDFTAKSTSDIRLNSSMRIVMFPVLQAYCKGDVRLVLLEDRSAPTLINGCLETIVTVVKGIVDI